MKRLYIITGASGHLAGCIIRQLRHTDCSIRGLILPTEAGENDEQLRYYRGDVTKPESMEAVFSDIDAYETIVIHTAGIISIESKVSPLLYQVNVCGTKNIIAQCKRHGVKRLLYVSSVHALPELGSGSIVREIAAFSKDNVIGGYAATKAEATQAVLDAAKDGLDAVVVHPSGIIGPYDDGHNHVVQMVKMYLMNKLPAGLTGGFDFVDVRDVAKGCLAAVDKGQKGECYILSNEYFTAMELIDRVREEAGGRKLVCLPIRFAQILAPLFECAARLTGTRPLYTRYALHTLSGGERYSHDKATAELGYHPRDIRETMADTVAWLNRHLKPVRL